jgi:hypothetical protein
MTSTTLPAPRFPTSQEKSNMTTNTLSNHRSRFYHLVLGVLAMVLTSMTLSHPASAGGVTTCSSTAPPIAFVLDTTEEREDLDLRNGQQALEQVLAVLDEGPERNWLAGRRIDVWTVSNSLATVRQTFSGCAPVYEDCSTSQVVTALFDGDRCDFSQESYTQLKTQFIDGLVTGFAPYLEEQSEAPGTALIESLYHVARHYETGSNPTLVILSDGIENSQKFGWSTDNPTCICSKDLAKVEQALSDYQLWDTSALEGAEVTFAGVGRTWDRKEMGLAGLNALRNFWSGYVEAQGGTLVGFDLWLGETWMPKPKVLSEPSRGTIRRRSSEFRSDRITAQR